MMLLDAITHREMKGQIRVVGWSIDRVHQQRSMVGASSPFPMTFGAMCSEHLTPDLGIRPKVRGRQVQLLATCLSIAVPTPGETQRQRQS